MRETGSQSPLCMLSCSFSYLDQLSTVVFRCANIVMLMFVCIVKRDGMRPTRVSIEIIPFSLDFVVISFIDHGIFIFYGISSIKEVRQLDPRGFCL